MKSKQALIGISRSRVGFKSQDSNLFLPEKDPVLAKLGNCTSYAKFTRPLRARSEGGGGRGQSGGALTAEEMYR